MKNQNYEEWTLASLKAEAQRRGLKGLSKMKKAELVALLVRSPEKKAAQKKTAAKKAPSGAPRKASKPVPAPSTIPEEKPSSALSEIVESALENPIALPVSQLPEKKHPEPFDKTYEIPSSYRRLRATLLPKNPDWLFFYWDLDATAAQRLREAEGGPHLRVLQDEVPIRVELLSFDHRRHYVAVPPGGGRIRVELGGTYGGSFVAIATSNSVVIDPARPSDDLSVEFAVPRWVESPYEDRLPPSSWKRVEGPATRPGVQGDVPWYRIRS